MGFFMTKTQPFLSPFNSQSVLFARGVYLPGRRSGSQAPWHRGNHGKSIGVELNLHPLLDLSLTKRRTPRCAPTLQSP